MQASSASDPAAASSRTDGPDQIAVGVTHPEAGAVVVTVGGEVDMLTSPQLRAALLEQVHDEAVELVVVALDGVTFLGTSGLAALIEVREAAHADGVGLRLACTGRRVLRPLSIAGLLPMFDIHDTVEAALAPT
ncbi:STAS domain-containing protein [Pseudonocardia benzenivorans]|jgi:anti-sigma B factor antagonist|nr:STAS domain-containing protein [Pseudonocardia dioxanivorans]